MRGCLGSAPAGWQSWQLSRTRPWDPGGQRPRLSRRRVFLIRSQVTWELKKGASLWE